MQGLVDLFIRDQWSTLPGAHPVKKVLVIEDDEPIRDFVVTVLVDAGYQVASGANGREGLERAVAFEPDVVLLDLSMPVMDGYEFLRRYALAAHAPVVVMSAQSRVKYPAGVDSIVHAFLEKPFDLGALLSCVGSQVGNSGASSERQGRAAGQP